MSETNVNPKKYESAKTLLWLSGILLLTGLAVMSPAALLFCAGLAALSAGCAILLSRKLVRIVSVIMTIIAILITAGAYPVYKAHMEQYRQRIENGNR